jgi:hypothetical protein
MIVRAKENKRQLNVIKTFTKHYARLYYSAFKRTDVHEDVYPRPIPQASDQRGQQQL